MIASRKPRLLFYAVNGVGLGHAVRLSILQNCLKRTSAAECAYYTDSQHVEGLFTCSGFVVSKKPRIVDGLVESVARFRPDTIVCDTYWPGPVIRDFRRSGIQTLLVLRMMNSHMLKERIGSALDSFDTVVMPHHPEEVSWIHRKHPALLRMLETLPVGFVGPIARRSTRPTKNESVIFTVGGGGDCGGVPQAKRSAMLVQTFSEAARMLLAAGCPKPFLAVGPLLKIDDDLEKHFELLHTSALHKHFGPQTVVVSRGGYNTCWEAIAAQSRLVLTGGSQRGDEDVEARCAFLKRVRLARVCDLSSQALFEAIQKLPSTAEIAVTQHWSQVVNAGIPVVTEELLGHSFLREIHR